MTRRTYESRDGIIFSTVTGCCLSPEKAEAVLQAHHELCAYWGDRGDLRPSIREIGVRLNAGLAWELAEAIRAARAYDEPHVSEQPQLRIAA